VNKDEKYKLSVMSRLLIFVCVFSAVIGEIDEEADANLDLSSIRADPLNAVVY